MLEHQASPSLFYRYHLAMASTLSQQEDTEILYWKNWSHMIDTSFKKSAYTKDIYLYMTYKKYLSMNFPHEQHPANKGFASAGDFHSASVKRGKTMVVPTTLVLRKIHHRIFVSLPAVQRPSWAAASL
jgi:hypothetical protein